MTRSEFVSSVVTFEDLRDFCCNNWLGNTDNVVSSEEVSGILEDNCIDYIRECGWELLRDALSNIHPGFNYYRREGWLDFAPLDDEDFSRYKRDVLVFGDNNNIWDEENEVVVIDENPVDDNDFDVEDESITIDELFIACREGLNGSSQIAC